MEEKKEKTMEEKKESRATLIQLLLIILIAIGIIYLGLNCVSLSIGILIWILGSFVGATP